MVKILAFSGSARKESYNKKLIALAVQGARQAGAQVTLIDLADYKMPIFDADLEAKEGIPQAGLEFKRLLLEHDALMIASPEYNSSLPPLLKNVLDWASRAHEEGEAPLAAYRGKVGVIMSASPGSLGGRRGLVFLRMLLENMGVLILPEQRSIIKAHKAFNKDGTLIEGRDQNAILELGKKLEKVARQLKQ